MKELVLGVELVDGRVVGTWPAQSRDSQGHSDYEGGTTGSKPSLPRVLPPMDTEHSAGQVPLDTGGIVC